ncbi:MAG TPA: A/G-specific adenine glycosylase [Casimicrobiaceae bacterium]
MNRRSRESGSPASFSQRIITWQATHGRHDLPWQNTRDAYRIWLSEVMLQQTQVTTVLPYYLRFTESFPDVRALAAAPIERVLEHWSGLGYYRRAHHLHEAARAVVARHGGAFPASAATLATLPGIGRSTAAAIAAFASGERGAILDGNVKRVLSRHAGIDGFPGEPRVAAKLWDVAHARLPDRHIERYTQGMMDLGATVCLRTRPRCDVCPVAEDCVARATHRTQVLPTPRPRKELPQRAVRLLVLEREGRILFEQRPPVGIWGGLLSLPELALDEDVDDALRSRFALTGRASRALPMLRHGFTHFGLTLHPQWIEVDQAPQAGEPRGTWLTRDAALSAALPAPIKRVLRGLGPAARGMTVPSISIRPRR